MSIEPILLRWKEIVSAWEQLAGRAVLLQYVGHKTQSESSYRWVVAVGDDG